MSHPVRYLLIPRVKIQNANAISSPYSIGFPSLTAWLGATHYLQRRMRDHGYVDLEISGTGIVSHEFNLHSFQAGYNQSIIGTGNPLTSEGKRPPFAPEARCHLTVSLIIEFTGIDPDEEDEALEYLEAIFAKGMRLAGGDVISAGDLAIVGAGSEYDDGIPYYFLKRIMPGFILIERKDLMQSALQQGTDQIDALLDYCAVHHEFDHSSSDWRSFRREPGWIVPIGVGFHGISEVAQPGTTHFQRDLSVPHRFAETIATLGEFVMPYRLSRIDQMIWRYEYRGDRNLYVCTQQGNQGKGEE